MTSAAERMRALLKQQETTQQKTSGGSDVFPHWDGEIGDNMSFRLLPDGDSGNPFFWRSKCTRKIPFESVKGLDTGQRKIFVVIPAMTTGTKQFTPNFLGAEEYNIGKDRDPIQDLISDWWNQGEEMQAQYRKYKRTWQHFYQGFVRSAGSIVEENIQSPVRRFTFNDQIHKAVPALLMQDDIRNLPTDFENGRDFKLTIAQQGKFKDYVTSWGFNEGPLSDSEIEALENHELHELKIFLPKAPSDEQLEAIVEMFEASVAGMPYEPERWGRFYKPQGIDISQASGARSQHQVKKSSVSDPDEEPEETVSKPSGSALLEKLKAKSQPTETDAPAEKSSKSEPSVDGGTTKSSPQALLAMLEARKKAKESGQ